MMRQLNCGVASCLTWSIAYRLYIIEDANTMSSMTWQAGVSCLWSLLCPLPATKFGHQAGSLTKIIGLTVKWPLLATQANNYIVANMSLSIPKFGVTNVGVNNSLLTPNHGANIKAYHNWVILLCAMYNVRGVECFGCTCKRDEIVNYK